MELVVVIGAIIAFAILLSIPARRFEKRTGKKMGRHAASGMLSVVNELFSPSAANAAVVLEEQKERRVGIPAGEDKDFERNRITITLPKKGSST